MKEFRDARYLVAVQLLVLQPTLVAFVTPLYFGALTRERGYSATDLATVTTAEVTGMVLVALMLSALASRVNLRHVALAGTVLLSLAILACALTGSVTELLACRFVIGIGAAMLTCATTIYIAATGLPVRWFGWQMTITTVLIMVGLAVMPLVEARWGLTGFYAVLLLLAPATLWAALVLPAHPQRDLPAVEADLSVRVEAVAAPQEVAPGALAWWNAPAILGVLAMLAYAGYVYPTYNYSERIGELAGVTPAAVAIVLSVTTPVGLVGSLLASAFPERFGSFAPIALSALGVAVASAALVIAPSSATFWSAMVVLSFVWNYAQPYLFGVIASADTDGRFLYLQSPAQDLPKAGMAFVLSAGLDAGDLAMPVFAGAALMGTAAAFAFGATRLLRNRVTLREAPAHS